MRIDLKESFGFMVEVLLFMMSGFILSYSLFITGFLFGCGLVMAVLVGKRIKTNAVKEYKEKCQNKNTKEE